MHDMADNAAPAAEHAASPGKPRLSADTRWVITTGVALGLLLVALTSSALLLINGRIEDTNNNVRDIRTDMQELRTELRTEMHAMRADLQTEIRERHADLQTEIRERHAETQTDIREMRTEMREMRSLLLQLLERTAPATPAD